MFSLLISIFLSFHSWAGVGGISGGHVEFQRESTFVSPLFNKTLCHDRAEYKAVVRACVSWGPGDKSSCVKEKKIAITQPIESTRQRCKAYEGSDGPCIEWETVRFYQNPVRTVDIVEGPDKRVIDRTTVVIPSCN